ncbi:MAG: FGGY family carbohydrate kinase [Thermomicrobiales bacterium]|nr:FGGY family carbohydrate kinase [Thermomicrobiales bacterium]
MPHSSQPLAIAIDIGSSSVRALAFDGRGRQLYRTDHRERYRPEITADGGSMCDPLRIRQLTAKCVRKCCEKLGDRVSQVQVVGISCHWHSLMGVCPEGEPITPVYMWSDKRASADATTLATELDEDEVHQRTGCRIHSSYWPAKLRWLERERGPVVDNVSTWCGLSDWLFYAKGVRPQASLSMASATGLMDTSNMAWDEPLLDHLGINIDLLPEIIDRSQPISPEWLHPDLVPEELNATWYPPLGDGAAANIGAGAAESSRIALTVGTSGAIRLIRPRYVSTPLPPGLFRYLVDADYEVIGGALSNGGNMLQWFSSITGLKDHKAAMIAAANIPPDSHGLTVLPFFAGERAPSWRDNLGGTITGMSLDTSAFSIYRALLEATGHRFTQVYDDLRQFADEQHTIMTSGGALLQSPQWCQIVADALGHELTALPTRLEASARGAAISSLQAHGLLDTLQLLPETHGAFTPAAANTAIYRQAQKRLVALESALNTWDQEIHHELD